MTAGHLAAQDVGAGPTEGLGGGRPEQPLAGRVEADDPVLGVDLEDEVRGAVDDRAELVSLVLERLAQPGAGERDGELVAGEQGDPQAIVVERVARLRPDGEEHRGLGLREDDGTAARDRVDPRSSRLERRPGDSGRHRMPARDPRRRSGRGRSSGAGCR